MAGIFSSFFINAIQNIGVMEPDMKPVITPTYIQKIRPLKNADNVNLSQGRHHFSSAMYL
jgi:hypothetical protein